MNGQNDINFDKVKNALIEVGFSEEKASNHLIRLGNVIAKSIIIRLVHEKRNGQEITQENIESFIEKSFSEEYRKQVTEEESGRITSEYLVEITKNLTEDKKRIFFNQIQQVL